MSCCPHCSQDVVMDARVCSHCDQPLAEVVGSRAGSEVQVACEPSSPIGRRGLIPFFGQFLTNPGVVGAVAPSSSLLANCMVDWIEWDKIEAVVEFGPGTGPFTVEILTRIDPETRFFAIELNEALADILAQRFPQLSIHRGDVRNVERLCEHEGIDQVDAVVSGLPWAAFGKNDQIECMQALTSILRPGGQFVTFAYLQGLVLPAGQRFRKLLGRYFSQVQRSPIVWRNFPPAFVYRCRL